jgi:hypothetical protein
MLIVLDDFRMVGNSSETQPIIDDMTSVIEGMRGLLIVKKYLQKPCMYHHA